MIAFLTQIFLGSLLILGSVIVLGLAATVVVAFHRAIQQQVETKR